MPGRLRTWAEVHQEVKHDMCQHKALRTWLRDEEATSTAELGRKSTRRRPLRGAAAGRAPTSTPQAATDQSGTSGQAAGVAYWRLPWRSSIQLAGGASRALATLASHAIGYADAGPRCTLARGGR